MLRNDSKTIDISVRRCVTMRWGMRVLGAGGNEAVGIDMDEIRECDRTVGSI